MNEKIRRYDVTICEMLKRTVSVQAANEEQAQSIVERQWKNSVLALDGDDFQGVRFTVKRHRPILEQLR